MDQLHSALATERIGSESAASVEFVLVRLRDSKTSERQTLHARPNSYSTAGWQTPDAVLVRGAGFEVFYDDFYPEKLWGKDLAVVFDDVFRKRSRFCLILISKQYLERPWTEHERRSALARMVTERGGEYVLPVQIDPVELPGLAPTIGYLSAERYSADQIADLLIEKLKKSP
jgi:hypothetical protein